MTESVGARLQQARELRRVSLQEVSEATKVRTHYLQALENDDQSAIPSAAQARGFLRLYAEFLELDLDELVATPSPATSPAASPAVTSAPAPVAPAARPGIWASLRQRLNRGPGKEQSSVTDASAADVAAPAEPPISEQPIEQVASTDVKTKTSVHKKVTSEDIKKNSLN